MRIGVIGLGRIGLMHARNVAQSSGVDEVVLIGRDPEKLGTAERALREALADGAPAELRGDHAPPPRPVGLVTRLADEEWLTGLDGVVIATSTGSHPELTRQAVREGVPVLVEKPLAMTMEEMEELVDEFAGAETPIMVAFHRRYDTAYQELRRRTLAGEAGTVRLVRAIAHDHHHITEDYMAGSGGIWRDLMVHDFDMLPWLLDDEVVSVYATGSAIDEPAYTRHEDLDTATAVLTFSSGVQGVITGARNISDGHDVRTEVYGSDAAFAAGLDSRVPLQSTEPGVATPKDRYSEFIFRFEPAFRREMEHFLKVVQGQEVSLTPPAEGLKAMRLVLAAEESVRTGRPVTL